MMKIPDWTHAIPWDSKRGELLLQINHILTEPVCPTVYLKWETSGEVLCRFDCGNIEDGVAAAIDWAKTNISFKEASE